MTVQEFYKSIGNISSARDAYCTDAEIARRLKLFPIDVPFDKLLFAWEKQDRMTVFQCAGQINRECVHLSLTKLGLLSERMCDAFRPGNCSRRVFIEQRELLDAVKTAYHMTIRDIDKIDV